MEKFPRKALIQARERLGLKQSQVADLIGVDKSVVSKVENGLQETGLDNLQRWANALGMPLDVFVWTELPERRVPSREKQAVGE